MSPRCLANSGNPALTIPAVAVATETRGGAAATVRVADDGSPAGRVTLTLTAEPVVVTYTP